MLDFIPKKKKNRNQSEFIPLFSKYSLSDSYLLSHCIILVNKVIKIRRTQPLPLGASELQKLQREAEIQTNHYVLCLEAPS